MQPNIVFIMTDQQRRDSLGIYGCRYVHTPNLDAFGKTATVYDHCYCDAPVCTPSRACILTGKTLPGHGVYNLFDCLPKNEKLLPYYLREEGYQTALVGKLHVTGTEVEAYERNPYDGYDIYDLSYEPSVYLEAPMISYGRWLEKNFPDEYAAILKEGRNRRHRSAETHFSTWVSERSAEVIRTRDKNKPLFLQVGYFDPHNPYDHYPKEAASLLHEEYYPQPIADTSDLPDALKMERKYHCPKALGADGRKDILTDMRRGYFAGVSFIDQQIQKIFDALRDEGIYDDTLIIFSSDHGDMLGDHELYSKGAMFYEQGVNVPLIVKFPGQKEGKRSDDLIELHDLFATMYQEAGGNLNICPESLPLQSDKKREIAITEYRQLGKFDVIGFDYPIHATMVRDAEWKLNIYHDTNECQLFHLPSDPNELNNLYGKPEYAKITQKLMLDYLKMDSQRDARLNAARGGRSRIPGFAHVPDDKK